MWLARRVTTPTAWYLRSFVTENARVARKILANLGELRANFMWISYEPRTNQAWILKNFGWTDMNCGRTGPNWFRIRELILNWGNCARSAQKIWESGLNSRNFYELLRTAHESCMNLARIMHELCANFQELSGIFSELLWTGPYHLWMTVGTKPWGS